VGLIPAQRLVCWTAAGVDPDNQRANPRAKGISLGHPLATVGMRMLVILANELPALDQRFALETM
jgi:acetyl-CoA acetyltransferase